MSKHAFSLKVLALFIGCGLLLPNAYGGSFWRAWKEAREKASPNANACQVAQRDQTPNPNRAAQEKTERDRPQNSWTVVPPSRATQEETKRYTALFHSNLKKILPNSADRLVYNIRQVYSGGAMLDWSSVGMPFVIDRRSIKDSSVQDGDIRSASSMVSFRAYGPGGFDVSEVLDKKSKGVPAFRAYDVKGACLWNDEANSVVFIPTDDARFNSRILFYPDGTSEVLDKIKLHQETALALVEIKSAAVFCPSHFVRLEARETEKRASEARVAAFRRQIKKGDLVANRDTIGHVCSGLVVSVDPPLAVIETTYTSDDYARRSNRETQHISSLYPCRDWSPSK